MMKVKTKYILMTNGEKYRIQIIEYKSFFHGLLKWKEKRFYQAGFNIIEFRSPCDAQEKIKELISSEKPWVPWVPVLL